MSKELHIYRVYAEEVVTTTYEQDVIASSKEEAEKLANESTEYHKWSESNDVESGTEGLEQTFSRVLGCSEELKSHKYEDLLEQRMEER